MREGNSEPSASSRVYAYLRSNVLGLVAIFIALNGTALAAQLATDGTGEQTLAKKKKKKPRPGPQGPQGPQGLQGAQGLTGAPGSARAWGRVSASGALSLATHVTGVTHTATSGVYCIALDPSVAPPVVLTATPDFNGDSTSAGDDLHAVVEWDSSVGGCASGGLRVDTFEVVAGAGEVNIKDEAFSFVVP
jgi:hypothetical protein